MFLKFPVCARSWAEEALSSAPGVDFGGQEGAPWRAKWSRNAARKRPENDLKIELVLEGVLESSWGPKKPSPAAGRRNGGGLRGG